MVRWSYILIRTTWRHDTADRLYVGNVMIEWESRIFLQPAGSSNSDHMVFSSNWVRLHHRLLHYCPRNELPLKNVPINISSQVMPRLVTKIATNDVDLANPCGQSYRDPWEGYVCTHQGDGVSITMLGLRVSRLGLHVPKLRVYTSNWRSFTTRLQNV